MSYLFGGNTNLTYEQMLQRRAVAEQLAKQMGRTPRNAGEGLAYIGAAIGSRLAENRAAKAEGRLREEANAAFESLFGGSGGLGGGGVSSRGYGYGTGATNAPAPEPEPLGSFTGDMGMADDPALTFGANPQPTTYAPEVAADPLMRNYGLASGEASVQPDPLMRNYGLGFDTHTRPGIDTGVMGGVDDFRMPNQFEPLPITGDMSSDPRVYEAVAGALGYLLPGGRIDVSSAARPGGSTTSQHWDGSAIDFRAYDADGTHHDWQSEIWPQFAQIGSSEDYGLRGYGWGPTYMGGMSVHADDGSNPNNIRPAPQLWSDDDGRRDGTWGADNGPGAAQYAAAVQAAFGRPTAEVLAELGIEQGDPERLSFGINQDLMSPQQQQVMFAGAAPRPPVDENERLMLARTLQAEAGNQGFEGMLDVGAVIRNRVASGRYGDDLEGVIMAPAQFSAWNSVTGAAGGEQGQNMDFMPNEEALRAADMILSGQYEDRTGGATHYYANIPGVSGVPAWHNDTFRQIDGDHFFGVADGSPVQGNTGPLTTTASARNPAVDPMARVDGMPIYDPASLPSQTPSQPAPQPAQAPVQYADAGGMTDAVDPRARLAQLMTVMNNPMLSEGQRMVAAAMMQQEMQRMFPGPVDPMDAIELEMAQIELQRAREGGGVDLPSSVIEAQWRAEQAGLIEGTPEYQDFILNGGGDPATFRALDMQAQAAGLMPGTPEYQDFMATRGAGLQSFASRTGTNQANIATGGEAAGAVSEGAALGTARAESTLELEQMQRSLPVLMQTVERLDELAGTATFGRSALLADDARRALGREVSEGGVARAEYIAIVDNEILPLLRQTFGAAFTEEEGARLRATLGNEDGTPAERRATLQAFIDRKIRELVSRGGVAPPNPLSNDNPSTTPAPDATAGAPPPEADPLPDWNTLPEGTRRILERDLSPEQLQAYPGYR